ncbi:uncharacterized protein LOC110864958 [Helianthus annuus]|uniref:uncharacterized protein LOC110864958 n=1 Tax=Helianthus annuus TaxID=4232 RepID=UPI000B9024FA|nr:uncharacterized protein LOC110864958 [Helianthus annuus]
MYRTARNRRPKTTSSETNQITDQDSDSLESTMGNIRMMILSTICNEGEGDLLTPEKRLLNSIEIVERVVMEELNRLKRTPAAEKAEREKKVRTLMSMRWADSCGLNTKWADELDAGAGVMIAGSRRIAAIADRSVSDQYK